MCLPLLHEEDPVIAYEAPRALHRAVALFTLIVLVAVSNYLRPEVSFTPGVPVGVDLAPPQGSTPAPPFPSLVWRPR